MNARKDGFLQALLANRSIKEAAKEAGIAERTAHLYLGDPEFQAAYRSARKECFDRAGDFLRQHLAAAVAEIADTMRHGNRQERFAAAKCLLDYGLKFTGAQDVLERLQVLEQGEAV